MTPSTIGKLEQAFALGCPKTVACEFAGINTDTLYEYIKKYPRFSDRIKQLQGLVGMQARKAVADAIKRGDARVAVDYLRRKHKDEFSEKLHTEHSGTVGVKTLLEQIIDDEEKE
jgi:hypothetical protein